MSEAMQGSVIILGGGLAGCEAALWLAGQGIKVRLVEQKPHALSPAHTSPLLAELVCSNSLKAERVDSAAGLLKAEMRLMGSTLLKVADVCRIPAGGALAVDRTDFSGTVSTLVWQNPNIELIEAEADGLPEEGPVIVATGPLTAGALAKAIDREAGAAALSFYDAAAPIVTAASIDMEKVFPASRYGRGEDDYLNCAFDKAGYEAFQAELAAAETAPLHDFDGRMTHYEGCMPVEVLAKRGLDTLRFGPLRPVGLKDPRTGHRPWANVQLRQEDADGTMFNLVGFQTNLKYAEQRRVFGMIPGLENAEFVRYGMMHRNSFLDSPKVLDVDFSLKSAPHLFFAGQITGFEGYMESAACGLLAARAVAAQEAGRSWTPPPPETMCGALCRYITAENEDFQPMGANMGLLPPLEEEEKNKQLRYAKLARRAVEAMGNWLTEQLQQAEEAKG